MKLVLTKSESKEVKEFISGVRVEKNVEKSCLEFIVSVVKDYTKDEYIVATLSNIEGIKALARTKEGKAKEYKTIRGLINFLNKEYECGLDKELVEKLLIEVAVIEVEEVDESKELEKKLEEAEGFKMDYEINLIKEEIKAYKVLANSTNAKDGYYLERRTAKIEDTFWYMLKGYIPMEEYEKLYKEWREMVGLVYSNRNLCIC